MADDSCRGCGKSGGDCAACTAITNWYISCGCDGHGDHAGCSKQCELYGCAHPRGITISGTLEESEKYSNQPPPAYLVVRAVDEERARAERKFNKKCRKLQSILEEALAS